LKYQILLLDVKNSLAWANFPRAIGRKLLFIRSWLSFTFCLLYFV